MSTQSQVSLEQATEAYEQSLLAARSLALSQPAEFDSWYGSHPSASTEDCQRWFNDADQKREEAISNVTTAMQQFIKSGGGMPGDLRKKAEARSPPLSDLSSAASSKETAKK